MTSLVKLVIANGVSLYLLSRVFAAFRMEGGTRTFVLAAVTFSLLDVLIRPLLELVLLPVNLLTLGMFRWVSSVAVLWLLTYVVSGIAILPYHFSGFSYQGAILPEMNLSAWWALVVASFLLSLIASAVDWFTHR